MMMPNAVMKINNGARARRVVNARQKLLSFEDKAGWAPLLDRLAIEDSPEGQPANRSDQLRRAVREYLTRRGVLESE